MTIDEILNFPYDPWLLLGVPRDADDYKVKTAWKRAGAPESGILAITYQLLKDKPSRLRTDLLNPCPYFSAADAGAALKKHPVYRGPGPWYKVIARRYRS